MEPFFIYLVAISSKLQAISFLLAVVFAVCTVFSAVAVVFVKDKKDISALVKHFVSYLITFAVIAVLIPDQNTLCNMFGVSYENVGSVSITDSVSKLIDNVEDLAKR